jgi:hypothetical protein
MPRGEVKRNRTRLEEGRRDEELTVVERLTQPPLCFVFCAIGQLDVFLLAVEWHAYQHSLYMWLLRR